MIYITERFWLKTSEDVLEGTEQGQEVSLEHVH